MYVNFRTARFLNAPRFPLALCLPGNVQEMFSSEWIFFERKPTAVWLQEANATPAGYTLSEFVFGYFTQKKRKLN